MKTGELICAIIIVAFLGLLYAFAAYIGIKKLYQKCRRSRTRSEDMEMEDRNEVVPSDHFERP